MDKPDLQTEIRIKKEELNKLEEKLRSVRYRIKQWEEALAQEEVDITATVEIRPANITYSWFNEKISTDTLRIMSQIELTKLKLYLREIELDYKEKQ